MDQWRPIYPKELTDGNYSSYGGASYAPKFEKWDSTARNSYSASFGFSQVLTKKTQLSIFFDVLQQEGKLSSPYHRIHFSDMTDYSIVDFKLADAIEKLPKTRFKLPIGLRWNYFVSEKFIVRTYYRYYTDDWDLKAHTASIELPIKLTDKFTVFQCIAIIRKHNLSILRHLKNMFPPKNFTLLIMICQPSMPINMGLE